MRVRGSWAALIALLMWVGAVSVAASPLTILYTNDLHLRFGRLESLERLIEKEREEGVPILLLDAGDALQDFRTPLAAVWGADRMLDWMRAVRYDAMALGNHEMYWGADRLEELAGRAQFPILCANLAPAPGYAAPFAPTKILDVGATRILLAGVVTRYHIPYPDIPWLSYLEPATALAEALKGIPDGVDLVVAVGHISVAEARRVAEAVPEIDVFVTGHSHEQTTDPVRVGGTLIVQSGSFGRALGCLTVDVVDGAARLVANELLTTEEASIDVDRGLRQLAAVALALCAAALLMLL